MIRLSPSRAHARTNADNGEDLHILHSTRLSPAEIARRAAAVAALRAAARARRGEAISEIPPAVAADLPSGAAGPSAAAIADGAPPIGAVRRKAALACLAVFRVRFPKAFGKPVPLAISIHDELTTIFADEMAPAEIALALAFWVRRKAYQQQLATGGQRFGLDGIPVGEVSAEHRALAEAWLAHHQRDGKKP